MELKRTIIFLGGIGLISVGSQLLLGLANGLTPNILNRNHDLPNMETFRAAYHSKLMCIFL